MNHTQVENENNSFIASRVPFGFWLTHSLTDFTENHENLLQLD